MGYDRDAFLEAAKPLMKWLNENTHPHMKVVVDCNTAEMLEGVLTQRTDEYIKD